MVLNPEDSFGRGGVQDKQFYGEKQQMKNGQGSKIRPVTLGNDDQLASALIEKLFDLVFSRPTDLNVIEMGQRLSALKKLLQPTHSKFGFALSDDTSSDSSEASDIYVTESGVQQKAHWSTELFTKRVRQLLERLTVFYHGEIDQKSQSVFTQKEQLVLRQTVRLAAISLTYFCTDQPLEQACLVQLLELLYEQVIEMRVEKQ